MKIQNDALQGSTPLETGRTQSTPQITGSGLTARHGVSGHGGDSVEISGLSTQVSESNALDSRQRETRIAQLAAIYAKGEYRVNGAALSKKMVDHSVGAGEGGAR